MRQMRKMMFVALVGLSTALVGLLGGCGASTATSPIHTTQYRQVNGQGWAQGKHQFGRRHGRWTFFDAEGRKLREGDYFAGVMHGEWIFYFENGDVVTLRYRNGIQVTPDQFAQNH